MSKILVYLPGNLVAHAEVMPPMRRAYMEGFQEALDILANAPVPVLTNFHMVDFACTETKPVLNRGAYTLMGTSYGHLLPSLLEKAYPTHVQWNYEYGVRGSPFGLFNSEFDLFRGDTIAPPSDPHAPDIMFALATGETFMYARCGADGVKSEGKLGPTDPIFFHDKIIVPLHGFAQAQKAFFLWQRLPTSEHRDALAAELLNMVNDGQDDVRVFFVDYESPIVGSHRGLHIWEEFFALLVEYGLSEHIVHPLDAAAYWRKHARRPEGPYKRYFVRQTGGKWTGLHIQTDWLMQLLFRPVNSTYAHVAWSFVTTSDVLAVMNRQTRGDLILPSEKGTLTISVNQDVVNVAKIIYRAFCVAKRPEDALHNSRFDSPDSRWYADRVADLIASYRS